MSDIALLMFKCPVCGDTFWSYTECKIKKQWNKYEYRYDVTVTTDYGIYTEQDISYTENGKMPFVHCKPITLKRKCRKCRVSHQLEEYMELKL